METVIRVRPRLIAETALSQKICDIRLCEKMIAEKGGIGWEYGLFYKRLILQKEE